MTQCAIDFDAVDALIESGGDPLGAVDVLRRNETARREAIELRKLRRVVCAARRFLQNVWNQEALGELRAALAEVNDDRH